MARLDGRAGKSEKMYLATAILFICVAVLLLSAQFAATALGRVSFVMALLSLAMALLSVFQMRGH
jgi:fatty acid desaturase